MHARSRVFLAFPLTYFLAPAPRSILVLPGETAEASGEVGGRGVSACTPVPRRTGLVLLVPVPRRTTRLFGATFSPARISVILSFCKVILDNCKHCKYTVWGFERTPSCFIDEQSGNIPFHSSSPGALDQEHIPVLESI